jgi:hypothetical protein
MRFWKEAKVGSLIAALTLTARSSKTVVSMLAERVVQPPALRGPAYSGFGTVAPARFTYVGWRQGAGIPVDGPEDQSQNGSITLQPTAWSASSNALASARCQVKNPGAPCRQYEVGGPPWNVACRAKLFGLVAGSAYISASASRRS